MNDSFDKELNLSINHNLRLKARILGFIFAGILILETALVLLFHSEEIFAKLVNGKIFFIAPIFLIGMAAIEFYIARLLSKQIQQNKELPKQYQYLGAFLEASFPTFVILFAAKMLLHINVSGFDIRFLLNSPPLLFYFIFIILSALHLEFRLCLFAGVIAAIEYLFLSFYLTKTFSEPQVFDYIVNIGKSVFILLSGIISGIVAQKIKEAVLNSLRSKNELIFRLDEKVKEKTKEINLKNLLLEQKNKDITDSINYAKKIQHAMLPAKEDIHSAFPDSFILFKPKDIVSGDFYFFQKNGKNIFIAAADCTGHGVPGALMSMIGSEKLQDAVLQNKEPSEILRLLNKGIRSSLRQSESNESTRDGMDIALCSVDTDNCIVKYAGANRPLWIIRKGQSTIEEIKATKAAIGGFTHDDQHFETHEVKLQKEDVFYIFSDGYADTFSGKDGKKLTTKKFKEVLLQIKDKPMQQQGQHLESYIETWKAGTEQVDDILVIGIRL
jgi:serine phosphatase RsbU (regulator of sigma subunit)